MDFTSKEKYAIITVLMSIMKADGVVEPKEQAFIDEAYRRLGINVNDLKNIATMSLEECRQTLREIAPDKKDRVQKCFLDMVGVDGRVDLRELRALREFM